jgi:hypothetical protein
MAHLHGMNRIQETSKSNQWAISAYVVSIIPCAIEVFLIELALLNLSGVLTFVDDLHGELSSLVRIFQRTWRIFL